MLRISAFSYSHHTVAGFWRTSTIAVIVDVLRNQNMLHSHSGFIWRTQDTKEILDERKCSQRLSKNKLNTAHWRYSHHVFLLNICVRALLLKNCVIESFKQQCHTLLLWPKVADLRKCFTQGGIWDLQFYSVSRIWVHWELLMRFTWGSSHLWMFDAVLYTMHAPAQCFAGHRTNVVFIADTYVYFSTGASVLYYVSHFDVGCCVLFSIIL